MASTPKVQLTRLALGIAGVAAVAGFAGRFLNGPAHVSAAVAPETGTTEQAPSALEAAPQTLFSWSDDDDWDDDDDDDDEEEDEEREHHGRREGRMQFAQPGAAGAAGTTQQQQPRTRSKHS